MDVTQVALQGLENAQQMLETAGARIARAGADATESPADVDTVDLSAEMVNLMQSRNLFKSNIAVIKTADEMDKAVVDILG